MDDDTHGNGDEGQRSSDEARALRPADSHDHDQHRTAELRSIELHRLVAERLDGPLGERALAGARRRVEGWTAEGDTGPIHPDIVAQWARLLALPLDELQDALIRDDEAMRIARQCSPWAGLGLVSDAERQHIIATIH